MSENQYPVSRDKQKILWKECMEDARELAQEYAFQVTIASAMFRYRIQFLPDASHPTHFFQAYPGPGALYPGPVPASGFYLATLCHLLPVRQRSYPTLLKSYARGHS